MTLTAISFGRIAAILPVQDMETAHLLVDDANAMFALCKQHGAKIIKGVQDKEYGLRAFVFADPHGNRIDVGQRLQV
nr:VOC family protein [uncultured Erwinia sp.]